MNAQSYRAFPHPTAFGGLNLLQHYYPRTSSDTLRRQLAGVDAYTRMREPKKPKHNPIYCRQPRELLQADLLDKQTLSRRNRGIRLDPLFIYSFIYLFIIYFSSFRYWLIIIDTFTRKTWVRPLIRKTAVLVARAFNDIVLEMGERPIQRLLTDKGSEFTAAPFQRLMRTLGIKHVFPIYHAPHAERVIRSLQSLIGKYLTENGTGVYHDVMDQLVATYNARRHRMIKTSPDEAERPENGDMVRSAMSIYYQKFEEAAEKRKKRNTKPRFSPGDWVRAQKSRTKFFRSFHETYSVPVYQVDEVLENLPSTMYTLRDLDDEIMAGKYYESELQSVRLLPFKIDKVFRNKHRQNQTTGEREFLVRWQGLPTSRNSYVSEARLP